MPEDKSIIYPPSNCPKCGKKLKIADLIPVLSYLMLKGKCRYCHKKISIRYPIVEVLTAILLTIIYWRFGISVDMLVYAVLTSILIIVAFMDLETMLIPDELLILGIFVGLAYSLFNDSFAQSLIGAASGFLFMFLLGQSFKWLLKKEALGDGDIKMVIMLGVFLGIDKTFISIFLGSIIGAILSILLVVFGKIKKESYIPYAPFLALGAFISIML